MEIDPTESVLGVFARNFYRYALEYLEPVRPHFVFLTFLPTETRTIFDRLKAYG